MHDLRLFFFGAAVLFFLAAILQKAGLVEITPEGLAGAGAVFVVVVIVLGLMESIENNTNPRRKESQH